MANNPEHESSEEHVPCPGPGGGVGVVAEILPVAEILLVALATIIHVEDHKWTFKQALST